MIGAYTRGVLFVHSAPRALCPHFEGAAAEVLGSRVHLDWTEQPAARGLMRAETSWVGPAGTGASLASALRGWANLRYEVTEEASVGTDGGRWSTPPTWGSSTPRRTFTATSSSPRTGSALHSSMPLIPRECVVSWTWRWDRRGTTSSSPSATRGPVRPCAGCTASARRRGTVPPHDRLLVTPGGADRLMSFMVCRPTRLIS